MLGRIIGERLSIPVVAPEKRKNAMNQYKVQIFTKNRGMLETVISARSVGQARMLAQEQYPDAHIGCITEL